MWNRIGSPAVAAIALVFSLVAAPAPTQALHGDPDHWTYVYGDWAPSWDPCSPITWTAPENGRLARAFARGVLRLARFTGYTFTQVSEGGRLTAAYVPTDDYWIVELGQAAGYSDLHYTPGTDGRQWFTAAQVRIDVTWAASVGRGALDRLMLHELGHTMGLGHVKAHDELMFPGREVRRYGLGDRAGLAAIHPSTCAAPLVEVGRADSGAAVVG